MNDFTVDIERETDGRWIGEVPELLADRLEHGEEIPRIAGVFAVHG